MTFDVETAADPAVLELLPPIEAQSNLKDPEKIKSSIAEKTAKRMKDLSLDPAYCCLVAIGEEVDGVIAVMRCPDEFAERLALNNFWRDWSLTTRHVGFNCVAFDLPVLMARSLILGVQHPHVPLRKYGAEGVDDLMLQLSHGGLVDYHSLDFWCKRLKLDMPDDPVSGKDIAALAAAGDWEAIAKHCSSDVAKTVALAERLRF